jgi:RNA polymerase sigma factor (sigma-70 family)
MVVGDQKKSEDSSADKGATLALEIPQLLTRLEAVYQKTADPIAKEQIKKVKSGKFSPGHLSNALMDIYRVHASAEAYSLLYELNYKVFFLIIFNRIRHYSKFLDPKDILQDVFLSIYRYPSKFRSEKENAFRNWSFSIIRNTILKHLKMRSSSEISTDILAEVLEDKKAKNPLAALANAESMHRFKKFYLFYLMLYIHVFNNYLSERAKQALLQVEVEGKRYREASDIMNIKLENFKMVVCRARKKIRRHLNQILGLVSQ